MAVIVGKPRHGIVERQRRVGRGRVQAGRPTKQQTAHGRRPIHQLRVYADGAGRQYRERIGVVAAHAVADGAFGEDALESKQAAVSRLKGPTIIVARAITRGREEAGRATTEPTEPATPAAHRRRAGIVTRQGDRVGVASIGIRLHIIEAIEHGGAVVDSLRRIATHGDRHIAGAQNTEQARHGVGRHTGGLEAQRAFTQQRLQILQATVVLERRVEERAIGLDRPGGRTTERHVGELLPRGETGLIEPLHLRSNQITAETATDEI